MPLPLKVEQLPEGLQTLVVVPKEEGGFDVLDEGPMQAMFEVEKDSVKPLVNFKVDEPLPWFAGVTCNLWHRKVRG